MSSAILAMMNAAVATAGLPLASADEPYWCSEHYEPSPQEALHQHDFKPTWGEGDEQVRVGLLRSDSSAGDGAVYVDVQYLPDGVTLDGSVHLSAKDARAFAAVMLHAAETAERPTRSRMGLMLRWFYGFGRASIAAVRSAKASSP